MILFGIPCGYYSHSKIVYGSSSFSKNPIFAILVGAVPIKMNLKYIFSLEK